VPAAVELTLLARFYERYADHAVAVAEQMMYAVVGDGPGLLEA
jgi:phosphate transport system protein